MIEFTPGDCDFSEPLISLKDERVVSLEAKVDPAIIAKQREICVRSTLKNFQDRVDKAIVITFPQLLDINIPANTSTWPASSYDILEPRTYKQSLLQKFHKDNHVEEKAIGFFLKQHRDLSTLVILDDFYNSPQYKTLSEKSTSLITLHKEVIANKMGFTINSKPGLSFLSDKNTHHARTCLTNKRINLNQQPNLNCFDQVF